MKPTKMAVEKKRITKIALKTPGSTTRMKIENVTSAVTKLVLPEGAESVVCIVFMYAGADCL